ncbi:MAG: amidohydrolase [Chloroflexi bacterium]|nr:amidohydrolase [Chloroflexota bacterium]
MHPQQRTDTPLRAGARDLIRCLDGSRVAHAVVSPAGAVPDNAQIVRAAASYPDRLSAVVRLDPTSVSFVPDARMWAGAGAIGIRVSDDLDLGEPRGRAAIDALADVCLELGLAVDWSFVIGSHHLVERVAVRAAGVRQVVDHVGWPGLDLRIGGGWLRDFQGVPSAALKLSGFYAMSREPWPYRDVWDLIEHALVALGPERTMWGSDWPLATEGELYSRQLGVLDSIPFIAGDLRDWILGRTAELFWFGPRGEPPMPATSRDNII